MKHFILLSSALGMVACAADTDVPNTSEESQIIAQADVAAEQADWGTFFPYFTADTHALSPVLVGVAEIKAGEQIHPPHRHADEEYMMITRGQGIWTLNGQDSPAQQGDVLFARSWDYHGIKAANGSPLEFVVFKYSARDRAMPTDPDPSLPEEANN